MADMYPTPHVSIDIVLDKSYVEEVTDSLYLWDRDMFLDFSEDVDGVRPVQMVPHYALILDAKVLGDGQVHEAHSAIYTKVYGEWSNLLYQFDNDWKLDGGHGPMDEYSGWHFDDKAVTNVDNITKWKVGVGNKGLRPDTEGVIGVATPTLEGDLGRVLATREGFVFEFTLGKDVDINGMSELGIYEDDGTTLRALCLFPNIEKHKEVELVARVSVKLL